MKRVLITAVVLPLTVALAACGGGYGGTNGSNAPTQTVSVKQLGDAGTVLVDDNGRALYAADQEARGKVLCTGTCTSIWTPLTASGAPTGDSLAGKLGLAKRPDGKQQVTYQGKLLYSFAQDQPGKVTGDGAKDAFGDKHFTWHVVRANGSSGSQGSGGAGSSGYSTGY